MGFWGADIFQDDFACDLRDLYHELVSLGFDNKEILDELQREFPNLDGIDESTYWIVLALLQHKLGRLQEDVKSRAIELINSGRSLSDWRSMFDVEDPSIKLRQKHLQKAKAIIISSQPPKKQLKPSKDLKERINKSYTKYPWKKDNFYAYRMESGDYVVFLSTAIHETTLPLHYAKKGNQYIITGKPILTEVNLLLFNYRKAELPSMEVIRDLRPFVQESSAEEREIWLKTNAEIRLGHEKSMNESFDDYYKRMRKNPHHINKSDAEFESHYKNYIEYCKGEFEKYKDPDQALQRPFYKHFIIDPKPPVPSDKVLDLNMKGSFQHLNEYEYANWGSLDRYLDQLFPLTL